LEYFITESFAQNEIDLEPKKQQVHTSETKQLPDVYYIIHDGYPIVEGDKVHSIWTFLRPVE